MGRTEEVQTCCGSGKGWSLDRVTGAHPDTGKCSSLQVPCNIVFVHLWWMANNGGQYKEGVGYMDKGVAHTGLEGSWREYAQYFLQSVGTFSYHIWSGDVGCVLPIPWGHKGYSKIVFSIGLWAGNLEAYRLQLGVTTNCGGYGWYRTVYFQSVYYPMTENNNPMNCYEANIWDLRGNI